MDHGPTLRWACVLMILLAGPAVGQADLTPAKATALLDVQEQRQRLNAMAFVKRTEINSKGYHAAVAAGRVEAPAAHAASGDFDEEPEGASAMAERLIGEGRARLAAEIFDRYIYGDPVRASARGGDFERVLRSRIPSVPPAGIRGVDFERVLRFRVETAARSYEIGEAARAKLFLAGHGDIHRTRNAIDAARAEFVLARANRRGGADVLERAGVLRVAAREPFGADSLYAKTLRGLAIERTTGRIGP